MKKRRTANSQPLPSTHAGQFKLDAQVMDLLEACAGAMEQIAHHALGKTALREAGAIKREQCCAIH